MKEKKSEYVPPTTTTWEVLFPIDVARGAAADDGAEAVEFMTIEGVATLELDELKTLELDELESPYPYWGAPIANNGRIVAASV